MKKSKLFCACLLLAGVMLTACESQTGDVSTSVSTEASVSTNTTTEAVSVTEYDYKELIKSFIGAIDTDYGYELTYKLAYDEEMAGECGFRTSASDYEHLCADFLAEEMGNIGLTDIEKIPVKADKWQFDSASLTIAGTDIDIVPASYAENGTDEDGITAEIVNCNTGFAEDYEGLDVEGKIVLVAVDQRNVEWIDSYIQEADLHGAAAVVSYSVGGYAMYSDDDRNIQDVCCEDIMPTVSISRNEATAIIEAIEAGNTECTLKVANTVAIGEGTSYTVVGKIKGLSSDQQIIYSGHYDKYYYGFQDDCAAISLIFTIAKAMKDSGYVPENDIMIVCHPSEEWGASDCQHDWTTGAWETINTVHPEWASKTIAMFNFELPGFVEDGQTSTGIATVPEYALFVQNFVNEYSGIIDNGTFENGISAEASMVSTMEDGISYRFAGVPYFLNGGVDFTDESCFAGNKYHTESDNVDTWSAEAFAQNAAIYGAMGIVIDRQPAIELDLSATLANFLYTLNEDYALEAGVDLTDIKAFTDELIPYAVSLYENALRINENYKMAVEAGDAAAIEVLKTEGYENNAESLRLFKAYQDSLIGLESSASVVIRHEGYVNTLDLLSASIEACKNEADYTEEEDGALDLLWALNSGYAYASYIFSSENVAKTYAMYARGDEGMYWGNSKVTNFADVDAPIRLLFEGDFENALPLLEAEYEKALEGYKTALEIEKKGLAAMLLGE